MEKRHLRLLRTETEGDRQASFGTDLLRKHVATIHCVNSFGLLQRKLVNALLYHAYHELLTKREHQITIRDLCQLTGYKSNDYKTIKNSLMELISTVIEWNVIEETKPKITETWNASAILADARIQGSVCTYSYSNRMSELLYMPEIYARLNMKIQARFKSSYGLALYENCIRYQNVKNTPWFNLCVFRKLMGVPEEKYPVFRDFKRRVLDSAVEEVNEHSSIEIAPEIQRAGQKVQSIKFSIQRKKRAFKVELDAEKEKGKIFTEGQNAIKLSLVEKFGFPAYQAELLLEKHSEEYLLEKIKLIEEAKTFKAGKILNPSKYLMCALRDDYQKPKSSSELLELKIKKKFEQQVQQDKQTKKEEKLKRAYSDYITKSVEEALGKLDSSKQTKLMEEFRNSLQKDNDSFILSKLEKKGLADRIVKLFFTNFIKKEFPEMITDLKQLDEFCSFQPAGLL